MDVFQSRRFRFWLFVVFVVVVFVIDVFRGRATGPGYGIAICVDLCGRPEPHAFWYLVLTPMGLGLSTIHGGDRFFFSSSTQKARLDADARAQNKPPLSCLFFFFFALKSDRRTKEGAALLLLAFSLSLPDDVAGDAWPSESQDGGSTHNEKPKKERKQLGGVAPGAQSGIKRGAGGKKKRKRKERHEEKNKRKKKRIRVSCPLISALTGRQRVRNGIGAKQTAASPAASS
ncbi:hypothetical protein MAPG_11051 [Magnaporthiopsis poae ATCC 64411]|uniref:Transmembrane protein n=1 Tax=Magnaporthiopsis poae (strain ATCC 64411 / 73-15) TaxID=644358 RepID=A0A0C4EE86_MAGP6|nr:hypothetical protein MAPG_11051 [Magnaporthiopsis poae ATCC 64411]